MSTQFTSFEEYKTALVEKVLKDAESQWKEIETRQRLLNLYKEFGFRSTADLIKALETVYAEAKGIAAPKAKDPAAPKAPKAKPAAKKGKRAKVTPEIAAKVAELKAQGITATQIAKTLGISQPTVYKLTKKPA